MSKLVTLVVVVVILGAVAWYAVNQTGESDSGGAQAEGDRGGVRVEEKYGFTSQGAGG